MQSSFMSSSEDNYENGTRPQAGNCQALERIVIDAAPWVPVHVVADPTKQVADDTEGDQDLINH